MPDPDKFRSIRVARELSEHLDSPARKLGWSVNKLAEECIRACLAMIDDPTARKVPLFVLRLDLNENDRPSLKPDKKDKGEPPERRRRRPQT